MAYTTINKSTDYFNTKLYTGNGGTNAITGVGHQPDWTWIKKRSGVENHFAFDSVRTATKYIFPNANNAEGTDANTLSTFTTDGFTVGTNDGVNENSQTFAAWNWKAGTSISGATTGSGTAKTYTGSVNTTAGFSIVKYTGNGTGGHQIPHGLGATPKMIFVKRTVGGTGDWYVYHSDVGNTRILKLNYNDGESGADASFWNNTSPNSTNFTVGSATAVNYNGSTYVAYIFAEKTGHCSIGKYKGSGSASNGSFINTGMKPSWVLLKRSNSAEDWQLIDNKRVGYNPDQNAFNPLNDSAEATTDTANLFSNGFKPITAGGQINASGDTYVYLAFGQTLVGSNNVPCTAR